MSEYARQLRHLCDSIAASAVRTRCCGSGCGTLSRSSASWNATTPISPPNWMLSMQHWERRWTRRWRRGSGDQAAVNACPSGSA